MYLFENAPLLAPLAMYALAVPMPGPSFVVITRTSLAQGRKAGMAAALGTTLGAATYATATLLGVTAIVDTLPWLIAAIQVLGGVYLIRVGLLALRSAVSSNAGPVLDTRFPVGTRSSLVPIFGRALLVSLGNPKIAAFFFALFAPTFGSSHPAGASGFVLCGIVAIDLVYHQTLAVLAARLALRQPTRSAARWLDGLAGAVMTGFGMRLVAGALRSR